MRESTNVNSMLTRFKEKEEILQKKKEEQKRQIEQKELSNLKSTPEITKTNFRLDNEGFYKRMEIKLKETDTKKKVLVERELNKRIEEAKLNPKLNQKINEKLVQGKIDAMIRWEQERKQKIQAKQLEEEKNKTLGCTFKPFMNLNSKKLVKNRSASQNILISNDSSFVDKSNAGNTTLRDNKTPRVDHADFRELKKNLLKKEFCPSTESTVSQSNDGLLRNACNFTPMGTGININLDPRLLKNISAKESKIMEELLRQRMSCK